MSVRRAENAAIVHAVSVMDTAVRKNDIAVQGKAFRHGLATVDIAVRCEENASVD